MVFIHNARYKRETVSLESARSCIFKVAAEECGVYIGFVKSDVEPFIWFFLMCVFTLVLWSTIYMFIIHANFIFHTPR